MLGYFSEVIAFSKLLKTMMMLFIPVAGLVFEASARSELYELAS